MWADLIQDLATVLKAALTGVTVVTYADAEVPVVDTVRVLRGAMTGRPVYGQASGEQAVNLEVWTKNDDAAKANQQLQSLESRVIDALKNLSREGPILKATVTGIEPDGDLFRPSLGSNIRVRVNWRQRRA